jgi:hypothetical protein
VVVNDREHWAYLPVPARNAGLDRLPDSVQIIVWESAPSEGHPQTSDSANCQAAEPFWGVSAEWLKAF